MLDGLVGIFAERDIETRKAFDTAAADYRATFASGEVLNRPALLEHCRAVETRIKERENEIADLQEMFTVMVAEKDKKFASYAEDTANLTATVVMRLNHQIETLGQSTASDKAELEKSLQQVETLTAERDNHFDAAGRAREENAGLRRTIDGLKFARQRAEEKNDELGTKASGLSATVEQLKNENEKLKKEIPSEVPSRGPTSAGSSPGPESLDRAIYHVLLDGRGVCPFTVEDIEEMIARRAIRPDTRIWRTGLENWSTVVSLPEFRGQFPATYTKTYGSVPWSHAKQPELYFVIDAEKGRVSPAMTLEVLEAAIASKKIQPSTWVWRKDMVCYDRAENVPELGSALARQMGTPSDGGFEH